MDTSDRMDAESIILVLESFQVLKEHKEKDLCTIQCLAQSYFPRRC